MTKFIFSLEAILESSDLFEAVGRALGLTDRLARLGEEEKSGFVPFTEILIKRTDLLKEYPVDVIADIIGDLKLREEAVDFINRCPENCLTVTGELDCYTEELAHKLNCPLESSSALVSHNKVSKILKVFYKESAVRQAASEGYETVFIGSTLSDAEAMRASGTAVVFGSPSAKWEGLSMVSDYLVFSGSALCRQLNRL